MKKKKLYLIIPIFVFFIIFSMSYQCFGFGDQEDSSPSAAALEREEKKQAEAEELEQIAKEQAEYEEAEQIAKEEGKKQAEAEEAAPAEEVAEEEKIITDEPITYTGSVDGVPVILIVNFKTTEVTGSISLSGGTYIDATINGKIDINTFEITTNYSGIVRPEDTDKESPVNGTITGIITDDLSTFNGIMLADYEDTGREFTATK